MRRRWEVWWTWQHTQPVKTKKDGEALAKLWKSRYEEKGWRVCATRGVFPGYRAYAPDYDPALYHELGPESKLQTIMVVELNERGKLIVPAYKPPKPKAEKPAVEKPRARRGRTPVGV